MANGSCHVFYFMMDMCEEEAVGIWDGVILRRVILNTLIQWDINSVFVGRCRIKGKMQGSGCCFYLQFVDVVSVCLVIEGFETMRDWIAYSASRVVGDFNGGLGILFLEVDVKI